MKILSILTSFIWVEISRNSLRINANKLNRSDLSDDSNASTAPDRTIIDLKWNFLDWQVLKILTGNLSILTGFVNRFKSTVADSESTSESQRARSDSIPERQYTWLHTSAPIFNNFFHWQVFRSILSKLTGFRKFWQVLKIHQIGVRSQWMVFRITGNSLRYHSRPPVHLAAHGDNDFSQLFSLTAFNLTGLENFDKFWELLTNRCLQSMVGCQNHRNLPQ